MEQTTGPNTALSDSGSSQQGKPKKERLASLESLRVFAILAVISQHTLPPEMFIGLGRGVNILFSLLEPLQRFPVPFFFMLSGYWFGKSIQSGTPATLVLRSYIRRLLPLFVIWSIISTFVPTTPNWWQDVAANGILRPLYWQFLQTMNWITLHPLGLLWFGTIGHLWFIPALLVGLIAVALLGPFQFIYRGLPAIDGHAFAEVILTKPLTLQRVAIPLIAVFYVIGLVERSTLLTSPEVPLLPYYIRTGLFMTLMFTTLGWALSFNFGRPSLSVGIVFVLAGYGVQIVEEVMIWHYLDAGPPRFGIGQYLVGTIPFLLGIFMIALARPNIGQSTILPRLAGLTLGVYLCHLPLVKLLNPVRAWVHHPIYDFALPFIIYLLAVGLTLLLSKFNLTNAYLVQVKRRTDFLSFKNKGYSTIARTAA